jgi:hypothetical protein
VNIGTMYPTVSEELEDVMDPTNPPHIWVNQPVLVELQGMGALGGGTGGPQSGVLVTVSELGITLRHGSGEGMFERFYPWPVIRSIRPRPPGGAGI